MSATKDRPYADMAATRAAAKEEAICARIIKKRPWRNMHALTQEQNWVVRVMVGLRPKEEKEDNNRLDSSDEEQIQIDLYRVFDCYFREKYAKGAGKGNDRCG
ncbi:Pyrophosphate-energized vacuolar membrane proton pump [Hordeum vulgare]|nr:Pyrophosphate-energized vacuolar membrane proton pump [Hordeum vulgare]